MREIKFRCWYDNQIQKVSNIDFRHKTINLFASDIIKIEDGILMQYTGFKDKNGIEIYEGDIIKSYANLGYGKKQKKVEIISQVIYSIDDGLTLKGDRTNVYSKFTTRQINNQDWTNVDWSMFFNCEVIGNIYETKVGE